MVLTNVVALVLSASAIATSTAVSVPSRSVVHAPPATRAIAVPFIDDDYAKAVAEARARKVPLFVEAWAPW